MRVDRALEKLHALLARRGVTSTTAALGLLMTNEAAAAAPAGLAASVLGPALAGANAASVAAWISFMNTTKSVAVAAGVMLSLAVGVGIQQIHAYHDAQTALTGEMRATEMLNARLQQERERADTAERDRADLERVVAAARGEAQRAAGRTVLGAPPGQSPTAAQMIANGHDFLRANPEARRLLVEYTRARTDGAWGPLLKSLRLTQEQIGAFHAAHEAAAGLYFGQTTGDVSMSMFLTEEGRISPTELNARVWAVLGEDGYRQWQEFNRVSPATSATANLAGDLYWSDSPLSRAQAERLTAILVDNSPDYAAGQNINLNKVNWPAALAQAGAVLDDPQLATLVAEREQSDYLKALNRAQQDARDRWQAARDAKAKD